MNVFVLCTGRCGSVTFANACRHMTNFTSAHESRTFLLGSDRLAYPEQHIEVDNRLSWFLGRLDRTYGDRAFYVHLKRDDDSVARSYRERYGIWIMKAYREGILLNLPANADPMAVCLDYCDTVNSNIELFLRDKTHAMTIDLAEIETAFPRFWHWIGAEGDLEAALACFQTKHNASHLIPATKIDDLLRLLRQLPLPLKKRLIPNPRDVVK
ncbi:hypothetical protein RYO59_001765 [Thermosynechococcaceae cyanobacterium Okahandja]